MSRFKLLYFVIFVINLYRINAQISDKRLCVDEECKVPISYAKTLLRYSSPDSRILSFAPNKDITIYSKSAGSREDLWGGEINGIRGYVPKHLVRETKILQKPTLLVDTEFSNDTDSKQVPSQVEPNKVQEPYEVVDGTTIYLNPQEAIDPTSTESPIQPTALPTETAPVADLSEGTTKETADVVQDKKNEDVSNPPQKPETIEKSGEQNQESPPTTSEVPELATSAEKTEPEEISTETEDDEIDIDDENDAEDDNDDDDDEDIEEQDVLPETKVETEVHTETVTETSAEIKLEVTDSQDDKKMEEVASGINVEQTVTEVAPQLVESPPVDDGPIQESEINEITGKDIGKEESVSQNTSEEIKEEIAIPEVTTLTPEIEVPQPFDDLVEVTPNPMDSVTEESKLVENLIPTLPPFGLFSQNLNDVATEKVESTNVPVAKEKDEAEVVTKDVQMEPASVSVAEDKNDVEGVAKLDEVSVSEEEAETEQTVTKVEEVENSIESLSQEISDSIETSNLHIEEGSKETDTIEENESVDKKADAGFFSGILSMFGSPSEDAVIEDTDQQSFTEETIKDSLVEEPPVTADFLSNDDNEQFCEATSCYQDESQERAGSVKTMDIFSFNSDVFIYLVTTAISVIIFLFGYIAFDKSKREGPLIAKINNLEKQLLILVKENQILQEKTAGESGYDTNDRVSSEVVENLKQDLFELNSTKIGLEEQVRLLEEQVQSLEKELENSTEVGMELNRMLSEILSSESGSAVLKANVEHLQRQLVEQQATVNSVNETLAITNTENHELRLELELSNKKVVDLQAELDKLLLNILKIEEEKEAQQASLENEVTMYKQKFEETNNKLKQKEEDYSLEIRQLKNRIHQSERDLALKTKEYDVLTETVKQLKTMKTNDGPTLQSLLDVTEIKAEMLLLKSENQKYCEKLQQEEESRLNHEKRALAAMEEAQRLREKYDEADKLKVETQTKLEVLSNYFKDREAQLQKEIAKHESLWIEKQGEATSTSERIKFMQEQLQNYKAQTESLKQEIMSQEVELKSQISVLEKKAHENWVSARQAERKLEEAKQEAAQLRHRLTLRERAIQEDKNQHRFQSPIEQNGDMPVSPLESPASPPLLYGGRDHITKSPPIPGLPPFLPPPPGVPFMPPPLHGVPPFIPPPPNMFPGDHRPPPLGRMSSPPLNSRYSPSSRGYSPYDSSPSDSEYGTSAPQRRAYSPFNSRGEDRRDYKRPAPGRSNGRNVMKDGGSSGSGHSNESLEKINRQQSKV